jgi:ABC-type spermidine/putrescine transport system permease subunit II
MRPTHYNRFWQVTAAVSIAFIIGSAALVVFPLAFSGSPFLTVSSFQSSWKWFAEALTSKWLGAVLTSTVLGLLSALLALVIGAPAAFCRANNHAGPLGWAVDIGGLVLLLVPPISLAVGYFRAYGETSWLGLLLGHTCLAFPFAYFSLLAGFRRLDPSLEEAAGLLGASPWSVLVRVALPASKRFALLGFALSFLISWDESVLSVFITGPTMETLPKLTWETMQRERDFTCAAINSMVAPFLCYAVLLLVATRVTEPVVKGRPSRQ